MGAGGDGNYQKITSDVILHYWQYRGYNIAARRFGNFSSRVEKYFTGGAQRASEVFSNTRRDISSTQEEKFLISKGP